MYERKQVNEMCTRKPFWCPSNLGVLLAYGWRPCAWGVGSLAELKISWTQSPAMLQNHGQRQPLCEVLPRSGTVGGAPPRGRSRTCLRCRGKRAGEGGWWDSVLQDRGAGQRTAKLLLILPLKTSSLRRGDLTSETAFLTSHWIPSPSPPAENLCVWFLLFLPSVSSRLILCCYF